MTSACEIAQLYDRAAADLWRGDGDAMRRIADRLEATWGAGPPEPAAPPAAVSLHGGGGRGIRWYDTATEVLGFVPGRAGCYRLPITMAAGWVEYTAAQAPVFVPPRERPTLHPLRLAS